MHSRWRFALIGIALVVAVASAVVLSRGDTFLTAPRVVPAANGSKLAVVSSAPMRTVSRIKVPEGFEKSSHSVAFRPYGWAPEGLGGERMVVRISTWESMGSVPESLKDLSGQNALFFMSEYEGAPVIGGSFEGRVDVRETEPGRGTLWLIDVKPTR